MTTRGPVEVHCALRGTCGIYPGHRLEHVLLIDRQNPDRIVRWDASRPTLGFVQRHHPRRQYASRRACAQPHRGFGTFPEPRGGRPVGRRRGNGTTRLKSQAHTTMGRSLFIANAMSMPTKADRTSDEPRRSYCLPHQLLMRRRSLKSTKRPRAR